MKDDDDITPEERARSAKLGKLVDAMMAGEQAPPALEAEARAMLETATAIHAAMGKVSLAPERKARVIDEAFDVPAAAAPAPARRPGALRRNAPWLVAAVCAAAAFVFMFRGPLWTTASVPVEQRSRPADALVGQIPRAEAGDASRRIDAIYADRLAGYQARHGKGGR